MGSRFQPQINLVIKEIQDRMARYAKNKKEIDQVVEDQVLSIFKKDFNQPISKIVYQLKSIELPEDFPNEPRILDRFVRKTVAGFLGYPYGEKITNIQLKELVEAKAQEATRKRYPEIKSNVARWYRLLKTQQQSSIDSRSINLTTDELAFAAIAPASTDGERAEALLLIKAIGEIDAVSAVLLETKALSTSKRRSNIENALRQFQSWRTSEEIDRTYRRTVVPDPIERAEVSDWSDSLPVAKTLEWSVLPPGWWNDPKYTDQITNNGESGRLLLERLKYIDQLKPLERWQSEERLGSDPYWVFVFSNHVVAECPTHGNAIYIVKGTSDWQNLLNRSKADILRAFPDRVVRIIHRGDWESRLSRILKVNNFRRL